MKMHMVKEQRNPRGRQCSICDKYEFDLNLNSACNTIGLMHSYERSTTLDFLMCKMDDNKYDAHEGTVWKMNHNTLMMLRMLGEAQRGGILTISNIKGDDPTICGLKYKIDNTMIDGEMNLQN